MGPFKSRVYGTIARHLHVTARQVAFILATLTVEESRRLPWFRVVAANGRVFYDFTWELAARK